MAEHKDIIVVGASAGGVETLVRLVGGLPEDLAAAVLIVLHVSPSGPSMLAEILGRSATLPVVAPKNGTDIRNGHIYVSSPDHHLVVDKGLIRNTRGPKENRARPSVDTLFRSAAYAFGPRVIGVVLTGALDDGTAGLWSIKEQGGTAVVQEPSDAAYPSMPESALRYVQADQVVPVSEMPALLARLAREPAVGSRLPDDSLKVEQAIELGATSGLELGVMDLGKPSPYTCPECHGVMLQVDGGGIQRFRCHTGHAFSVGTLLSEVTAAVETSTWNLVRSIEESILLLDQLARHHEAAGEIDRADALKTKALAAQRRMDQIREVMRDDEVLGTEHLVSGPMAGEASGE